ncbi:hypothetical protein [Luteolibacter pohnpeiensis]|uniref:hypothetical protein n=1 Tax=Luteolibacter pohnpeiensis TaxID=454153 RepID=UPI0019034928|nr:hypothetical protein [Luteolibacter pohnpeiensis]
MLENGMISVRFGSTSRIPSVEMMYRFGMRRDAQNTPGAIIAMSAMPVNVTASETGTKAKNTHKISTRATTPTPMRWLRPLHLTFKDGVVMILYA